MTERAERPHDGHRERLRRRFRERGLEGFDDHQVLELLLFQSVPRRDTNPIAHRLLERFGTLAAVLEADPRDLCATAGMGERSADFLALIPSVARRYLQDRAHRGRPRLDAPEATIRYVEPLMAGRSEEVFYLISLDSGRRALRAALLGAGTTTGVHIHPRRVVEEALRRRAAAVILAHNHPGGEALPSRADRLLTRRLSRILRALEIPVLDHVIIADAASYSFAAAGELP